MPNFRTNSPKVRGYELESEEEFVFKRTRKYIFVESESKKSISDL